MAKQDYSDLLEPLSQFLAALVQHGMAQQATVTIQPAALDIEDAAKYIGVSRSKLYELKDAGHFAPKDNDGKKVYLRKDLDSYLRKLRE